MNFTICWLLFLRITKRISKVCFRSRFINKLGYCLHNIYFNYSHNLTFFDLVKCIQSLRYKLITAFKTKKKIKTVKLLEGTL